MQFPNNDHVNAYQSYVREQARSRKSLWVDLLAIAVLAVALCWIAGISAGRMGQICVVVIIVFVVWRCLRALARQLFSYTSSPWDD